MDCRSCYEAKMPNARMCVKIKFLQDKQQLKNDLKLNLPGA